MTLMQNYNTAQNIYEGSMGSIINPDNYSGLENILNKSPNKNNLGGMRKRLLVFIAISLLVAGGVWGAPHYEIISINPQVPQSLGVF